MSRKRGQNTGSISYVAARDRYRVRYDAEGNGKPLNRFFLTKREAESFLAQTMVRHRQGYNVDPEKITVGDYLDRWLAKSVQGVCREKTYMGYESTVRVHLKPSLGTIVLQKLTVGDVQAMVNSLKMSGKSPRTVGVVRDVLRNALNQAVADDLLHRNVAEHVKLPKQTTKKKRAMDFSQAADFLERTEGQRFHAVFAVALLAGLRISECLGLTWDQVDYEAGELTVVRQLQRLNGRVAITPPKSDSGHRVVKMPAILVPILKAHRSRQLEQRLQAGSRWTPYELDLVFTNDHGGPTDDSRVRRDLRLAMESCGLSGMTMHDLRRSYCTMSKALGVDDKTLQTNMGHTDIRLTLQTYTLAMEDQKREAAEALDAALRSRSRLRSSA